MSVILVVVLIGNLGWSQVVITQRAVQKTFVGNIRNRHIPDGCGCYFTFRHTSSNSEGFMFFASVEENAEQEAWMNIDGADIKLGLVKKTDPKERERVGSRSSRRYVSGDIVVDAIYVATRICRPNDENCESTDYAATFTIRSGRRTQTVKAVGGCGC